MMVSRRNFAMLTAIMLVVLFMFQSAGVAKNQLNDAQTNEYALENRSDMEETGAFSAYEKFHQLEGQGNMPQTDEELRPAMENRRMVMFIGNVETSRVIETVRQWCTYSKRGLAEVEQAAACADHLDRLEMLLVDGQTIDLERDVPILQEYVDHGVNVIMCSLPDVETVGANVELEKLLGIVAVYSPRVELTGIQLFDGFLLGGQRIFQAEEPEDEKLQDMDLTVPWYLTLNGNKSYMIGLLEELDMQDGDIENEYAPNLIWRTSTANGQVYVVNGDYLEDVTGIGILEAMAYEMHEYEVYPIVNAQNFSIVNYPSFANENSQEIMNRYSRELPSLFRDVIWQSVSSVAERNRSKVTAMLAPQHDYTDENEPQAEAFTYYAKLFHEKQMELGLSMEQVSEIPLEEKIERDLSFLNENLADYEYRSVYVSSLDRESRDVLQAQEGLKTITTVLTDYNEKEPLLEYKDGACIQRATNEAFSHTYTENFRMRSIESALGYTSVILNMDRVAYPKTEEDNWEKLYEEFSANLHTYWKDYSLFDKTTLSESDVRVRRFLNLDFAEYREEDVLTVEVSDFEHEAFFILRTHDEQLKDISGGSFEKMEENVYLICAEEEKIQITLENDRHLEYYIMRETED